MAASLQDLLRLIEERKNETQENISEVSFRPTLNELFTGAINQTMIEIKKGADSDSFTDLVVINFITKAANKNYSANEIKNFIDNELLN